MITLTENAKMHISTLGDVGQALRIAVVGGGCSGLSYKMEFIPDSGITETDQVFDQVLFKVVVDKKSFPFLKGVTMDYDGGLNGKAITFVNPNTNQNCGCGKSFC